MRIKSDMSTNFVHCKVLSKCTVLLLENILQAYLKNVTKIKKISKLEIMSEIGEGSRAVNVLKFCFLGR